MSNLTIRTFFCAAVLLLLFHLSSYICLPTTADLTTPSFFTTTTSDTDLTMTSHLTVALSQKSTSPPILTLRVTNTHPSTPLTFVTWNTPLDPAILPLGNLAVKLPGNTERLNKDTIKIARKTPPAADQFVTLAPGESREQDVELKKPLVPLGEVEGGKVVVECQGSWGDVWEGKVGPEEWEGVVGKGEKGEWGCEAAEVEV